MNELLVSLGVNIASSAIYDFLKQEFSKNQSLNKEKLTADLASFLELKNAEIVAEKIVTFLAENGDIKIEGTSIYANDSISMFSSRNTKFEFGNNSTSETRKTKISASTGAFIVGHGGAGMKQNEDGSISFYT